MFDKGCEYLLAAFVFLTSFFQALFEDSTTGPNGGERSKTTNGRKAAPLTATDPERESKT